MKIIENLIRGIFHFFPLHKLFAWLVKKDKIDQCYKMSTCTNVTYYPEATVVNHQSKKENIQISDGSHIRGTLLIFGYGGKIVIGKNCYVGEDTRIWSGEKITIGNDVLISHNVNIMDNNGHEMDHLLRAEGFLNSLKFGSEFLAGRVITIPVVIEDNVWVGFGSIILKGVTLGKGSIVASGSVVTKDVPPFTMVGGNPARVLKNLTV